MNLEVLVRNTPLKTWAISLFFSGCASFGIVNNLLFGQTSSMQILILFLLTAVIALAYSLLLIPRLVPALAGAGKNAIPLCLLVGGLSSWILSSNVPIRLPLDGNAVQRLEIIPLMGENGYGDVPLLEIKIDERKIPFKEMTRGGGWDVQGGMLLHGGDNVEGVSHTFKNRRQTQITIIFQEGPDMGRAAVWINGMEREVLNLRQDVPGERLVEVGVQGVIGPPWLVTLLYWVYAAAFFPLTFVLSWLLFIALPDTLLSIPSLAKPFVWGVGVIWLVSILAVALFWLQTNGLVSVIRQSFPVPVQAIQPYGSYGFGVPMGTDRLSQNEIFSSPATLLEDGYVLGPGNTSYTDIVEKGGGLFSFWKGTLVFSSSDNSDPRVNGRQYTMQLPVVLDAHGMLFAFSGVLLLSFYLFLIWSQPFPHLRRRLALGLGVVVIFFGLSGPFFPQFKTIYSFLRTQLYIKNFDPQVYEKRGSDYCNPRFDPERIGKELRQIDKAADYDFTRLAQTRAFLWGVERRTALKHIFDTVTAGAQTDMERHIALLRFLQKVTYHNYFTPGIVSHDPLVYLELGEMWCGDVSHLAIDLFSAAGYRARAVELSRHQIAEIYYDNDWHYFDADVFSGGGVMFMPDGTIPSVDELSQPGINIRLDRLPTYYESLLISSCYGGGGGRTSYGASFAYFSSLSYAESGAGLVHYVKSATPEEERLDPWNYGWHKYEIVPDTERILEPLPLHYTPSLPYFDSIVKDPETRQVRLTFHAKDGDDDMVGYRIYISKESRSWDYAKFYGTEGLEMYWSSSTGWEPEMYDAFHRLPPSDVDLVVTKEGSLDIYLPEDEVYYLSIMAYDAYGELVGRELYPASNEIKLSW